MNSMPRQSGRVEQSERERERKYGGGRMIGYFLASDRKNNALKHKIHNGV